MIHEPEVEIRNSGRVPSGGALSFVPDGIKLPGGGSRVC